MIDMKEIKITIDIKKISIRLVQILSCFMIIPIFIYIGYYYRKYKEGNLHIFKKQKVPISTNIEKYENIGGISEY